MPSFGGDMGVVDVAYDEQNIERIIALARDADQLFIEAPFLDVDARYCLTGAPLTFHFTSRLATGTERTN
jgi:hypothetical protein